jgi:hypothetical protein
VRLYCYLCFCVLFSPGAIAGESWTCKLTHQIITCNYSENDAADSLSVLENKMASVVELLNGTRCTVIAFDSSGKTASDEPPTLASVEISAEYRCAIANDGATEQRRVAETGHKRYSLDCVRSLFKFYASGFDIYIDGSRSHWDSQGTARPIPWRVLEPDPKGCCRRRTAVVGSVKGRSPAPTGTGKMRRRRTLPCIHVRTERKPTACTIQSGIARGSSRCHLGAGAYWAQAPTHLGAGAYPTATYREAPLPLSDRPWRNLR